MMTTLNPITPAAANTATVLVVGRNFTSRRRVEFLIRMAGFDTLVFGDELETANWLQCHAEIRPAAIVVFHDQNQKARGVLLEKVSERDQVPVIDLLSHDVPGTEPDTNTSEQTFSVGETQLLEILHSIVSLKPITQNPMTLKQQGAGGYEFETR